MLDVDRAVEHRGDDHTGQRAASPGLLAEKIGNLRVGAALAPLLSERAAGGDQVASLGAHQVLLGTAHHACDRLRGLGLGESFAAVVIAHRFRDGAFLAQLALGQRRQQCRVVLLGDAVVGFGAALGQLRGEQWIGLDGFAAEHQRVSFVSVVSAVWCPDGAAFSTSGSSTFMTPFSPGLGRERSSSGGRQATGHGSRYRQPV
ncbi:hypothetical protein [Nocardia asteroides]|uniref:hypothetical protein n=1 Tax=Nocardia asteroides TaxID=1824 RepID=UPI0033E1C23E